MPFPSFRWLEPEHLLPVLFGLSLLALTLEQVPGSYLREGLLKSRPSSIYFLRVSSLNTPTRVDNLVPSPLSSRLFLPVSAHAWSARSQKMNFNPTKYVPWPF